MSFAMVLTPALQMSTKRSLGNGRSSQKCHLETLKDSVELASIESEVLALLEKSSRNKNDCDLMI